MIAHEKNCRLCNAIQNPLASGELRPCDTVLFKTKNFVLLPAIGPLVRGHARKALLVPSLPLKASRRISASGLGHGGTDISDGFGADLHELCKASSVGAVVNVERIPTAPGAKQAAKVAGVPAWRFAFASGGDFQFIVTTGPSARRQMNRLGLYEVGEITKERKLALMSPVGVVSLLPTKGHRDSRRLTFAAEIDALIKAPTKPKLDRE